MVLNVLNDYELFPVTLSMKVVELDRSELYVRSWLPDVKFILGKFVVLVAPGNKFVSVNVTGLPELYM